ncbi:phospholipase D-like domain-containing protein, partial [Mycobacterium avium]
FARTIPPWRRLTVGAAAALLTACSSLHALAPSPPAARSADHSSYQLIQEPEAGYSAVLDIIRHAHRTLLITMYELADPAAVGAVIDAHRRGVDTKIILDAAFHGRQTNSAAYDQLTAAGVDVRWAPAATIFHQKTLTADDTETAIGTANLVAKYYPSSRDAWVLDHDPTDIAAITATFDTDYSAATVRPAPGTPNPHLIWSPDARATFLQHLDNAGHSIELTTEELKDRAVVAALTKAAHRGLTCHIVLTTNPATTHTVDELTTAGCQIHQFPADAKHLYMHEKMILIDRAQLIIGSQNLSTTSLLENRELSLLLTNDTAKGVLDAVAATFDHDYRQASP